MIGLLVGVHLFAEEFSHTFRIRYKLEETESKKYIGSLTTEASEYDKRFFYLGDSGTTR